MKLYFIRRQCRPASQPTVAHVKIKSNDLRWMTNEINQFSENGEIKFQFILANDTLYTNKSGRKIVTKNKIGNSHYSQILDTIFHPISTKDSPISLRQNCVQQIKPVILYIYEYNYYTESNLLFSLFHDFVREFWANIFHQFTRNWNILRYYSRNTRVEWRPSLFFFQWLNLNKYLYVDICIFLRWHAYA